MRKIVFLLLSVVLVISLFAIPAYAADGNVTIEVTADKSEVHPGDTITYTFTLKHNRADGVSAVEFGVGGFPSGVTQGNAVFDQAAKDAFKGIDGQGAPVFNSNKGHYVFTAASGVTTTEIRLMTLTCTVDKTAKVNEAFVPAVSELSAVGGDKQAAAASPSTAGASVTVTHTAEAHHSFNADPDTTQDATCQAAGKKVWKCTIAGCTGTKEETIAKLEHDWGEVQWKWNDADMNASTASVTCPGVGGAQSHTANSTKVTATSGQTTATCTNPGQTTWNVTAQFGADGDNMSKTTTYNVSDKLLGHDFDGVEPEITEPATCMTAGEQTITCKRCQGEEEGGVKTETITALGHNFEGVEPEITKPADCETDGEQTTTCKRCQGKEEGGVKTETIEHLGHHWEAEPVFTWTKTLGNYTASAELKCTTEGLEHSEKATAKVTSVTTDAGCEKAGETVYTATASFNGQEYTATEKEVLPATGHKWDATFEWENLFDPKAEVTVKATLSCANEKCDGNEGKGYKGFVVPADSVKISEKIATEPTCTTPGEAEYTAEVTPPAGPTDPIQTERAETKEIAALGHDYGENKPVVEWPELENENAELTADQIGDVTLVCNRDGCTDSLVKGRIKPLNIVSKVDATYLNDGKHIYTVTAVFPDGKNGEVERTSEEKTYTIPKLEAEVDASASGANVGEGAQTALKNAADALVESALKGEKPAGMPDAVFQAIQKANSSNQSLTVTTELVTSPADVPSDVPGGVSAINASIKITINNTDIEEYTPVSGYLTEVPEAISLSFPKPAGGPIFYVLSDHGGSWSKIGSKVEGENIVFTTKQFSTFVLVGSNDLANASITVDPQYAYTGAVIRPVVKVTINGGNAELKEGTDYEVAVDGDPIKPGEYKVTIKGINNYTGSVTKTFTILEPEATTAPSATPTATAAPTATPTGAPATGDETPVVLYAVMLTVCAAALTLVLVFRRKRQK